MDDLSHGTEGAYPHAIRNHDATVTAAADASDRIAWPTPAFDRGQIEDESRGSERDKCGQMTVDRHAFANTLVIDHAAQIGYM